MSVGPWTWTDESLARQLVALIPSLDGDGGMQMCLYQNNYTPHDGDSLDDYVECDFDGYAPVSVSLETFGSLTVSNHVAASVSSTTCVYIADSTAAPQMAYGYFWLGNSGPYVGGERFEAPVPITALAELRIKPVIRLGVLCVPEPPPPPPPPPPP